jgi:HK97 family phage prohead protease
MQVQVRKDVTMVRQVEDDAARKIAFVLSSADVDRDGDTVDPKGWVLDPYRANPVVLWHHDTSIPPIAKSESIDVVDGKLKAVAVFPPKGVHALADTVYELVKGGWVNGASVGFNGIERSPRGDKGYDYKKCELYEWSILPVPAHRGALREAEKAGVDMTQVRKWVTLGGADSVLKAFAEDALAPAVKYIRESDGKFCVYSEEGKRLGCHDSRKDAERQLAAIEANKGARPAILKNVDGVVTIQDVLARSKAATLAGLHDALRVTLASIEWYEKDSATRRDLVSRASDDFARQYEAVKEADEIERLAKDMFGGGGGGGQPPPQQQPPPGNQPPPQNGDDSSGDPKVDAAYDKLWADVKAAMAMPDPQSKANALKAALEEFATVVMGGGQQAPGQPPAPQQQAPPAQPPPQRMGVADLMQKVGRVLSGKNEERLRAALAALGDMLSTLPQMPEAVAFVDGDSTTTDRNGGDAGKGLTDSDVREFMTSMGGDETDKALGELGFSKTGLRDAIAQSVKEAMEEARTALNGRLPD